MLEIFISHSSRDREIASKLIQVLRNSLNISSQNIRCTSVPGYKLKGGVNTDETLREEVGSCKVMIGIISISSLESVYVLFELGARWGMKLPFKPIVYDDQVFKEIKGPLNNLHIINISNDSEVFQLLEEVSNDLGKEMAHSSTYFEDIKLMQKSISTLPINIKDNKSKEDIQLDFSDEEATLLLESSQDSSGRIAVIKTKDGLSIQTNGKSFCNSHDGRLRAQWQKAIDNLHEKGFIDASDSSSGVFYINSNGYQISDQHTK